jgi:hypothetical protein
MHLQTIPSLVISQVIRHIIGCIIIGIIMGIMPIIGFIMPMGIPPIIPIMGLFIMPMPIMPFIGICICIGIGMFMFIGMGMVFCIGCIMTVPPDASCVAAPPRRSGGTDLPHGSQASTLSPNRFDLRERMTLRLRRTKRWRRRIGVHYDGGLTDHAPPRRSA